MTRSVNFLMLVLFFTGAVLSPVAAKPFAVHYALKGIVDLQKGVPYLHTADGRVFQLLMKADAAKSLDGKAVGVNGKVGKSDDVEQVKVKKIAILPDQNIEIPVVEHESYQRPAKILQNLAGTVTVENIRWDIRQNEKSEKKTAIHTWETATIDPDKVKSAYLLVKPFAPKFIAAHTLMAFSFADGGVVAKTGKKSNNLVLSIEAYKKVGQSYGLVKTMKKEFDIVWILTNLKNYAELNDSAEPRARICAIAPELSCARTACQPPRFALWLSTRSSRIGLIPVRLGRRPGLDRIGSTLAR